MEIRHLRYFLAVAETSSFRRAAEQSFVAQSALSQQIARLERELGNPLFVRSSRGVRLTPAGETLVPLATRIIAEVEHAAEEMAALAGLERGRLRLGIIQTGASAIDLIALIAAYRHQHPGIDLVVRTGASRHLADETVAGALDVAIVALPPAVLPPTLVYRSLVNDPLVGVLSRSAARDAPSTLSVSDLIERGPFIHYRPDSGLRHTVQAGFDRAGLTVRASFELDQIPEMIRLAALDGGVTIVPQSSTQPIPGELQHTAEFVAIPLADDLMVHTIGVVHDRTRHGRAGAAFIAALLSDSSPAMSRQRDGSR